MRESLKYTRISRFFTRRSLFSRTAVTAAGIVLYLYTASVPLISRAVSSMDFGAASELVSLLSICAGGSFYVLSPFSLGLSPYISASVLMVLAGFIFPDFMHWQKQPENKKSFSRLMLLLTLPIAAGQAYLACSVIGFDAYGGIPVQIAAVVFLSLGAVLLAAIALKMTEYGLINGMTAVIAAGIFFRFPYNLYMFLIVYQTQDQLMKMAAVSVILAVFFLSVTAECAYRKIRVRNAASTAQLPEKLSYFPVKLCPAGVMPIILASAVLSAFALYEYIPDMPDGLSTVFAALSWTEPWGMALYGALIILFSDYFTRMNQAPDVLAEELKQAGAVLDGVRPGEDTARHLSRTMRRAAFAGALIFAAACLIPMVFNYFYPVFSIRGLGMSTMIFVNAVFECVRGVHAGLIEKGVHLPGVIARLAPEKPEKRKGVRRGACTETR